MVTETQEAKRPLTVWLDDELIARLKREQRRTVINVSTQIRALLMEKFPPPDDDEPKP